MKRLVMLLLLAVLPLQMTWAAGMGHCPRGADHGDRASVPHAASHAADGLEHSHDEGDDGSGAGWGIDCSVFQFVALAPPAARAQSLPRASATAHVVARSGYKSHIPPGLDRPKWRFAA
jgi:hypothetical protein